MSYWRSLAEAGRWGEINIYHVPEGERQELLALLRQVVPIKEVRNGTETVRRHLQPKEIEFDKQKRAAAEMLDCGELDALVEASPPTAVEMWESALEDVHCILAAAKAEGEVTDGDGELSRAAHIDAAYQALDELPFLMNPRFDETSPDDEGEWLAERFAEVAYSALNLGLRTQSAFGKPMERDAHLYLMRREKHSLGGKMREQPHRAKILAAMKARLDKDPDRNVSEAARNTFAVDKFGKSKAAVEALWYREMKKSQ